MQPRLNLEGQTRFEANVFLTLPWALLPVPEPEVQVQATAREAEVCWRTRIGLPGTRSPRRVLIYNYGHFGMKIWSGYELSARLLAQAEAFQYPVRKQPLGISDAYGQCLPVVGE